MIRQDLIVNKEWTEFFRQMECGDSIAFHTENLRDLESLVSVYPLRNRELKENGSDWLISVSTSRESRGVYVCTRPRL